MLELDEPITRWLPELTAAPTVRELLTHTAGLPLDLPRELYGAIDFQGVRTHTLAAQPCHPPGLVSYSNLGYGWIAYALELATGQSLGTLLGKYDLLWVTPSTLSLSSSPMSAARTQGPYMNC